MNQAEFKGEDLSKDGVNLYAKENFEGLPGLKKTLIHK